MTAGVRQIVRFNWTRYAGGATTIAVIAWLIARVRMVASIETALIGAAIVIAFWTAASLGASWLVYDHSDLTRWAWIGDLFGNPPRTWLNLHAGFDETSRALGGCLGGSGRVFDIYDPLEMTEASIARARSLTHGSTIAEAVDYRHLPAGNDTVDAAFLLFSAHELRSEEARVSLFRELRRVIAPTGRIVVVEHLRDPANWAAFGPGAMHFLSRRTWMRCFDRAGLIVETEHGRTPFVRVFALRREP